MLFHSVKWSRFRNVAAVVKRFRNVRFGAEGTRVLGEKKNIFHSAALISKRTVSRALTGSRASQRVFLSKSSLLSGVSFWLDTLTFQLSTAGVVLEIKLKEAINPLVHTPVV